MNYTLKLATFGALLSASLFAADGVPMLIDPSTEGFAGLSAVSGSFDFLDFAEMDFAKMNFTAKPIGIANLV